MSLTINEHSRLVGQKIRDSRKSKRISLEQLSTGTGLSVSFLSQMENGKLNVSLANIKKIADFLDVRLVNFFEDEDNEVGLGVVTQKGKGIMLTLNGSNSYCESLIRKSGVSLQATLYISQPGEGRKIPFSHAGEEFVYVIEGEILFFLNDEKYRLQEGDSMYYRGEAQHSFINSGPFQSKIILVNTPQHW